MHDSNEYSIYDFMNKNLPNILIEGRLAQAVSSEDVAINLKRIPNR